MLQASATAPIDKTGGWSTHWNKLWRTPDQRAEQDFQSDNFEGAAKTFSNPDWKASALYRDGQFEQAASLYGSDAATVDSQYNHGNALAMGGQLEQALTAYDEALKLKPDDEDAVFNRELVTKLLEQQKKEEQEQQQACGEQPQDQQQLAGGDQPLDPQQQAGDEQAQADD